MFLSTLLTEVHKMDYKKSGLKIGLEIHQQLKTHKLFCKCPSEITQAANDFTIKRELRSLAGESGKIDIAALYEKTKGLHYIYEGYNNKTCLVEMDEEPPHELNKEALEIALLIAKMLHCKFPDVIQVMRKTVVDGSNTSGFQRTVLIGKNGYLKTSAGTIGIETVILEEDSARRVGEDADSVTFRLDRLGIPLVEITTKPDIKTPEQAKEAAELIGSILRSTGKVLRGLGTIRQDLNISIKGRNRIELKGVQDLRNIPKIVEIEMERQKSNPKEESHVRNVKPDLDSKYLRPIASSARMYPETDLPILELDMKLIKSLKIPELLENKEKRFMKIGLSESLANQMARGEAHELFEKLIHKYKKIKPSIIADTIASIDNYVQKKTGLHSCAPDEQYEMVFELLDKNKIVKETIPDIFIDFSKGLNFEDIKKKHQKLTKSELAKEIEKIKTENKDAHEGKLIGIAMGKLRGKAEPQDIMNLIKRK